MTSSVRRLKDRFERFLRWRHEREVSVCPRFCLDPGCAHSHHQRRHDCAGDIAWEAALTLGLPLRRVWLGIVLPQAVRTVLPVLGNQVVAMFKESSLLSTITVMELLAVSTSTGSLDVRYVEPLTMAGFFYFVISYIAARGLRRLEASHVVHG